MLGELIAAINVVVWLIESASEYAAARLWRGLAQGVEHALRIEAYDHAQRLVHDALHDPRHR